MISTADALKVMSHVAACHHRTAPRMDDREATLVTAEIWAELFNHHRLELKDLLTAVKKRATDFEVAPEPAEIIRFARELRRARDAETGPTPDYQALCESKFMSYDDALRQVMQRTGQRSVFLEVESAR